jgi:hypothetical protein
MTYAYAFPAWELSEDTYLLKLQRMKSKLHIGPRFVYGFDLPYVYDYITKLCKKQAEVIQNHKNEHVRGIGQGRYRKYKKLKLGGRQAYDISRD